MDAKEKFAGTYIKQEFVTASNINCLLDKYEVPSDFDLLSIDIDGQDIYVWRAIERRPMVVVIEYNAHLPCDQALAVIENPEFRWDKTSYYGASLLAVARVGESLGYKLIHANGINAFLVRIDLLGNPEDFQFEDIASYRGYRGRANHKQDKLNRQYVEVRI